jgi:acetyl-CoA carboxylase biotin carboxyl carrier protein
VTLTAADVAEIMRIVETSKFDELSLDLDGVRLRLRRTGASGGFAQTTSEAQAATPIVPPGSISASGPVVAAGPADANLREITSPMLGTFYRAPKPGSAPFVEIGSAVDEDSVIAVIEVMKLMNTIRAGIKGVITEILPADESLVEFGEVLMRARTDA